MDYFTIFSLFVGFIIGIVVHESAHAWMGHKLGDPTAKNFGRISLNPIKHIDPVGSVLLPLIGLFTTQSFFGWAKPTPYNPDNLHGPVDEILIAIAGPISNFILAIIVYLFTLGLYLTSGILGFEVSYAVEAFIFYIILENLILGFFNLLPIPPLDGSKFIKAITPNKFIPVFNMFNEYGFYILMFAAITPLGNIISLYVDTCVDYCLRIAGYY